MSLNLGGIIQGAFKEPLLSYVPSEGKGFLYPQIRGGKDEQSPIRFLVHRAIPLCPSLCGK